MSDKRSVTTDALETLGTIIDENAGRDAIHLAVFPAKAGDILYPGQRVELSGNTAKAGGNVVGIVDPFLSGPVYHDQHFWLVLLPRTITSLRHVWEHPAFTEDQPKQIDPKAESEEWLRTWCRDNDCPDYETVLAAISGGAIPDNDLEYPISYIDDGEYITFYGTGAHASIPEEFWKHAEIVLGRSIRNRAEYFSCSC